MRITVSKPGRTHAVLNGLLGTGVTLITTDGIVRGTLKACHGGAVLIDSYDGQGLSFLGYEQVQEVIAA